jgi:hypothetical protein
MTTDADPPRASDLLRAPERLLERFDREAGSRAVLALAAIFGAGLLPAVFSPTSDNVKTQFGGARHRDGFAPARLAVAFSFLPTIAVLPIYWWVRWFAGQENALGVLLYGLPVTAAWGTWILARGLKSVYRVDSLRAAAASSGAVGVGPWFAAALGLVPFVFVVLVVESLYVPR